MKKNKLFITAFATCLTAATPMVALASCGNKQTETKFAINFTCSEGVTLSSTTSIQVKSGTKWKDIDNIPTATVESGYLNIGWYDINEMTLMQPDTEITKDTNVKYVALSKEKTIVYVTVKTDKQTYESVPFLQGSTFAEFQEFYPEMKQTPTKEGYIFDGWFANGSKITDEYVFPEGTVSLTIEAHFVVNTYITITDEDGKAYIADLTTLYSKDESVAIKGTLATDKTKTKEWPRSTFNCKIEIGAGPTSIGDHFLYFCQAFNQPITISSTVTSIGERFLDSCYAFNQPITISNTVTTIGDGFLIGCSSFNQPVTIPNNVWSIGNGFLQNCAVFNSSVTLSTGLTSIGDNFLCICPAFNQPITIPSKVQAIGMGFMQSDTAFNQPITIPNNVTTIDDGFLAGCSVLNSNVTVGSGLTKVGYLFLANCKGFNKTIDFSSIANPSTITFTGSIMLENVDETNTITFKVASGTKTAWTTKLQKATGKTTLPTTWVVTEA